MTDSFTISTDAYQGPLEALLDLIEARKLSVSEVSLAEVTDAYLAYVEHLPELPLGETAQFIVIASTLLLIKSRSLLPTLELSEEERESVEELERRLARYAHIRAAAKVLRKEWNAAPLETGRRTPAQPLVYAPGEASVATIRASITRLVSLFPKPEKMASAVVAPVLKLEEVIASLRERISRAARARWSELSRGANKHVAIVHFLAILELVRSGSASVTQEALFSDIVIESEDAGLPRYGM